MTALEPRHLNILRRMRDLGGWQYAEAISPHGDGRTVGATLSALERRGLVAWADGGQRMLPRVKADGTRTQICRSATTWAMTADGLAAAR